LSSFVPLTASNSKNRHLTKILHLVTHQLFESRNEAEDVFDSADDKNDQFDRQNGQRNSIADRRRMYESRSLSVQEEKPASPTIK
jgi:coronin-7